MFRVKCIECDNMILKMTAKKNNGFCARCYKTRPAWELSEKEMEEMGQQMILGGMIQNAINFPDHQFLNKEELDFVEKMYGATQKAVKIWGMDPASKILLPMLLSKLGKFEEALDFTLDNFKEDKNWNTAIALACAYRRAGNLDKSVETFREASKYDEGDVTCWLEIGDIYLEGGKYSDALGAYQEALNRQPEQQWALPSAFFCKHKLELEGNWMKSLEEVANQEGCTCGLQGCLTEVFGGYGSEQGIARAEYLLEKLSPA